ncbi:MAG: GNAT family N-acetyltransferase [Verrucomicrobiota bacterium]|nr:GNAT family N-acetyltransferase [Verrucomicrobiota bacterium]
MSSDHFSIRAATLSDAPLLLAMVHAAFEQYRHRLIPPSSAHAESLASITQKLAAFQAFICSVSNEPAGCVFYLRKSDHMYLDRLSVLQKFRRQGVGSSLIRAVEQLAIREGYSAVRLGVRIALPATRAYYERLGFTWLEDCFHEGFQTPTYILMQKLLKKSSN